MKKLLLISVLIITAVFSASSQNANRSGIFMEAGLGLYVGTPPVSKIQWKNNTLSVFRPGGPDVNFGVGYRGATSSIFAWEVRMEITTDVTAPSTSVLSVMPGFRITSKEIFGNSSLYFGLNLGVGVGPYKDDCLNTLYYLGNDYYSEPYVFSNWGGKMLLCGGLNITPSFYAGLYLNLNITSGGDCRLNSDYYYFEDSYYRLRDRSVKFSDDVWGSIALRLGYRF